MARVPVDPVPEWRRRSRWLLYLGAAVFVLSGLSGRAFDVSWLPMPAMVAAIVTMLAGTYWHGHINGFSEAECTHESKRRARRGIDFVSHARRRGAILRMVGSVLLLVAVLMRLADQAWAGRAFSAGFLCWFFAVDWYGHANGHVVRDSIEQDPSQ